MIQPNLKILFTKIHKKILKYNFSIKLNTWYDFYIFLFFLFYILLSLISIGERRRKKEEKYLSFQWHFYPSYFQISSRWPFDKVVRMQMDWINGSMDDTCRGEKSNWRVDIPPVGEESRIFLQGIGIMGGGTLFYLEIRLLS